jgi:aspartate aminotransferase
MKRRRAHPTYIGCATDGTESLGQTVLLDDSAVTPLLLNPAHLAAMLGAAYGHSPWFRIFTAASETVLTEAMAHIRHAIGQLE